MFVCLISINSLFADEELIVLECQSNKQIHAPIILKIDFKVKKAYRGLVDYYITRSAGSYITLTRETGSKTIEIINIDRYLGGYEIITQYKAGEFEDAVIQKGNCIKRDKIF